MIKLKNFIVVDVEADGPCPGLYSMVSFGAVLVTPNLEDPNIFYGETSPVTNNYTPEALDVIGINRAIHKNYTKPDYTIPKFYNWLSDIDYEATKNGKMKFISDNPAFDWQWINYYFHKYKGTNPFGFSARRIGDIYSGANKDLYDSTSWKKWRKTSHNHNPVNDALGNAEALLHILNTYEIKF